MKRTFAFLMVLIMVLSCCSAASAVYPGDSHVHSYTTVIDPGRPATCTEGGGDYCQCVCGAVAYVATAPLGHLWSEGERIMTASGPMLQQYCYRCGAYNVLPCSDDDLGVPATVLPAGFDGSLDGKVAISLEVQIVDPKSEYTDGDYIRFRMTLTNIGEVPLVEYGVNTDVWLNPCSITDTKTLEPGESKAFEQFGIPVTKSNLDNGINTGHFWGYGLSAEGVRAEADDAAQIVYAEGDVPAAVQEPCLRLEVYPNAAAPFFGSGEETECTWIVTNLGDKDCTMGSVSIMGHDGITVIQDDTPMAANGGTASGTLTLTMPLNLGDGSMMTTYSFRAATDDSAYFSNQASLTLMVLPMGNPDELDTWTIPVQKASVRFCKSVYNKPEDPAGYHVGETVLFRIQLANCDDRTLTAAIEDPMIQSGILAGVTLAPQEEWETIAAYQVTEADAANGAICNKAYASLTDAEGNDLGSVSAAASAEAVPWDVDYEPALTVSLTEDTASSDPAGYTAGEIIGMTAAVTNNTDHILTNVYMEDYYGDTLLKGGILLPYQTIYRYFEYVPSKVDVCHGSLTGFVTATALYEEDGNTIGGCSQTLMFPLIAFGSRISVAKTELSVPAAGTYYVLGEKVAYEIAVRNTGDETFYTVDILDLPADNGPVVGSIDELAPGEVRYFQVTHTIDEYDVSVGEMINIASASYSDAYDNCFEEFSNTVVVETKPVEKVTVTKTETSKPAFYPFYLEGEEITYQITITNHSYHKISGVAVKDCLNDTEWTTLWNEQDLEPHGSYGFIFSHIVTAEDAERHFVTNYATAETDTNVYKSGTVESPTGKTGPNPDPVPTPDPVPDPIPTPDPVPDPIPDPTPDPIPAPDPDPTPDPDPDPQPPMIPPEFYYPEGDIRVTKIELTTPANGSCYELNEVVGFRISIINDGDIDYSHVDLFDWLNYSSVEQLLGDIDVPAHTSGYKDYYYQIAESDVARGYVTNIGYMVCPETGYIYSDPVKILTRDPNPTITAAGLSGDDCCRLTLKALGTAAAEYDQHFCAKHLTAWQEASEAATAAEVRKAWEEPIAELLDAIQAAAGKNAAAVLQEKVLFNAMVNAREEMLRAIGTDEAAIAAQLNELLYAACTELCSAAANAPADRSDSYLSGAAHLEDGCTEACGMVITETRADGFAYRRTLCKDHSVSEAAIQNMLAEDALKAFSTGLRLRQSDLDRATNALYLASDAAARPAVAADRQAFGAWAKHHISFLELLCGEAALAPYELTSAAVLNRIVALEK